MDNNILYKLGTLEDVEQIEEIEKEAFKNPWSYQAIIDFMSSDKGGFIVVKDKDIIAGYISFYVIFDECHIANVAVKKEFQRMGYGKALLDRLVYSFTDEQVSSFILEVRESNASALSLYQKFGFKILGERKNYYENQENAIMMEYRK